ncbi:MAG TPA: glutamate-5-semialdehyde dehydrogenase [Dehalococcoidia bacterium]|nr:glutamate-5-semialdehyde dehydrogenase [Dehalococcoidia bacterium]
MTTAVAELQAKARAAKAASKRMAFLSTEVKNRALHAIAEALADRQEEVLTANRQDYQEAKAAGMAEAMLDRLLLHHQRLEGMAADVRSVAALPDPVGEMFDVRTLPNGLIAGRRRVPLGVIGVIYESRPNVTVDIAALCLKSGNACILRGGKEALRSSQALATIVAEAAYEQGIPQGAVQFVDNPDRALVGEMLKMREQIDLMVPRGGAELIRYVSETAAMPVVAGGIGVCHSYVDRAADIDMAVRVVYNAKCRRPTICNALDTLLIHAEVAPHFLPPMAQAWAQAGVEMRCDGRALALLGPHLPEGLKVTPAAPEDFGREFLALKAAVRIVDSLDEALEHIERYGSGHSEAIITEDYQAAMRFLAEADAAAVYVNASTQFTDGAQFGLGAEVGISTQKMHARGPMGLRELTTYKWIIMGSGQTRPG